MAELEFDADGVKIRFSAAEEPAGPEDWPVILQNMGSQWKTLHEIVHIRRMELASHEHVFAMERLRVEHGPERPSAGTGFTTDNAWPEGPYGRVLP